MKKKLLLFVAMVAVLTCMLAVSICGAELIDGLYYSLSGSGDSAYATLTTDNANIDFTSTNGVVEIPETVTKDGVTYKVTSIAKSCFSGSSWNKGTTIKKIIVPSSITFVDEHAFRELANLEEVIYSASYDKISNGFFYKCPKLRIIDMSGSKVKTIGDNTFFGDSALEKVVFSNCIETISGNAFSGSMSGEGPDVTIVFPSSLKSIAGKQTFSGTSRLKKVVLQEGLITLGNNVFQSSGIETIVIPKSVTTIGEHAFNNADKLKYIIMPDNYADFHSYALYESDCKVILFQGTEAQANEMISNSKFTKSQFTSSNNVTIAHISTYDPQATYTKPHVFYGLSDTCSHCNGLVGEREFVFTSLAEVMKDQALCTNCGAGDVTTYPAVFTNLGFATFDINHSITQGFVICKASLELYNEKFPESQVSEYGLVAVAKSRVDSENTAFDSEGNNKTGVTSIEMSNRGYDLIEARITGFDPSQTLDDGTSYADIELYINAYVYVGDTIYYLSNGQSGTTLTGAITYNSVK